MQSQKRCIPTSTPPFLDSYIYFQLLCILNNGHRKKHIPTRDRTIKTTAPRETALRLPILVTAMVCTFSVKVVDPVPVPHRPAKRLVRPSRPIPRLKTPGVGGLEATNNDDA